MRVIESYTILSIIRRENSEFSFWKKVWAMRRSPAGLFAKLCTIGLSTQLFLTHGETRCIPPRNGNGKVPMPKKSVLKLTVIKSTLAETFGLHCCNSEIQVNRRRSGLMQYALTRTQTTLWNETIKLR
jgi:hypothetical protein